MEGKGCLIAVLAAAVFMLLPGCAENGEVGKRAGKKILMVVAHENFRDEELFVPKGYFEKRGADVSVASTRKGEARGSLGGTVNATLSLEEVNTGRYDAIIFVGGPGTPSVRKEERALEIAKEAVEEGKVLGAICWAPTILAKAGVLEGKNATVWRANDPEYGMATDRVLERFGANYVGGDVAADGKIVTADGPAAAEKFAEKITGLLK